MPVFDEGVDAVALLDAAEAEHAAQRARPRPLDSAAQQAAQQAAKQAERIRQLTAANSQQAAALADAHRRIDALESMVLELQRELFDRALEQLRREQQQPAAADVPVTPAPMHAPRREQGSPLPAAFGRLALDDGEHRG